MSKKVAVDIKTWGFVDGHSDVEIHIEGLETPFAKKLIRAVHLALASPGGDTFLEQEEEEVPE